MEAGARFRKEFLNNNNKRPEVIQRKNEMEKVAETKKSRRKCERNDTS